MRSIIIAAVVFATSAAQAVAQMSQDEMATHALHGLMTMYAAGSVCSFNKWSFSKQDTDEMLHKIKELSKNMPKNTNDEMWAQAQAIMAEGQASATKERCAQARQQYATARPFLFKIQPQEPQKAPL